MKRALNRFDAFRWSRNREEACHGLCIRPCRGEIWWRNPDIFLNRSVHCTTMSEQLTYFAIESAYHPRVCRVVQCSRSAIAFPCETLKDTCRATEKRPGKLRTSSLGCEIFVLQNSFTSNHDFLTFGEIPTSCKTRSTLPLHFYRRV